MIPKPEYPQTFELYDKGIRIIDSINSYQQCEYAEKWLDLAWWWMRDRWWHLLSERLLGKKGMFTVA